jgi:hypothetical protein
MEMADLPAPTFNAPASAASAGDARAAVLSAAAAPAPSRARRLIRIASDDSIWFSALTT